MTVTMLRHRQCGVAVERSSATIEERAWVVLAVVVGAVPEWGRRDGGEHDEDQAMP